MRPLEEIFSEQLKEELKDEVTVSNRLLDISIIIVSILIGLFYIIHQIRKTGFFTEKFGIIEMIMFYGILVYWIIASVFEFIGHKNIGHNFDAYGGLIFVIIATIWLLAVFPFEFTYFADVFPINLKFLVIWISDVVAQVFMVIGVIIEFFLEIDAVILRTLVRRIRKKSI